MTTTQYTRLSIQRRDGDAWVEVEKMTVGGELPPLDEVVAGWRQVRSLQAIGSDRTAPGGEYRAVVVE